MSEVKIIIHVKDGIPELCHENIDVNYADLSMGLTQVKIIEKRLLEILEKMSKVKKVDKN